MPPSEPVVAFQGEPGAFSDAAARALIDGAQTRGFPAFDDVAAAVAAGEVDLGLLPIENSIAGPIARTYDLLWEHRGLHVVDETVHRVELTLIAVAGADPARIREVRSHPVALEQVRRFLSTRSWTSRAVHDTAGAVAQIVAAGDPEIAAIGPEAAAALYGADVLERSIQDDPNNFTRMFLVARDPKPRRVQRRACIGFELADKPGALRDALSVFADHGVNLRSLVSRPDRKTPFQYRFYCELEDVDANSVAAVLPSLGENRVLGVY
jgi:prephenate dehydratase